jgi:hypothetical protein
MQHGRSGEERITDYADGRNVPKRQRRASLKACGIAPGFEPETKTKR